MRRWLLVVLVALLPLRAWAGDAMALSMALTMALQAPVAAAQHVQTQPAPEAAQAPHDCHGHAAAPAASAAPGHDAHAAHASAHASANTSGHPSDPTHSAHDCATTCMACQMCHQVSLPALMPLDAASPAHTLRPADAERHFVSATVARGHKPPIS